MRKHKFLLGVSILLFAHFADAYVFPGADWEVATPESQNVNSEGLKSAVNELAKSMGVSQLFIVRNGYAIWKGPGSKSESVMASSTKTVTSTMLGVLATGGTVKTSDPVSKTRPGQKGTWRQWASFSTSGSFKYSSTHMEQYVENLTYVANQDLLNLFKSRVATPIGMKKYSWGSNGKKVKGITVRGGAGDNGHFKTHAEDWARLCYLYLRKGNWNGKQVLSEQYVSEATTNQADVPGWGGGRYGYNLWLNTEGALPDAPPKTFWSWGRGGRTCVVVPEWDMVIVRLGKGVDEGWNLPNAFFKTLSSAVK